MGLTRAGAPGLTAKPDGVECPEIDHTTANRLDCTAWLNHVNKFHFCYKLIFNNRFELRPRWRELQTAVASVPGLDLEMLGIKTVSYTNLQECRRRTGD
jgi:hypothetical protein